MAKGPGNTRGGVYEGTPFTNIDRTGNETAIMSGGEKDSGGEGGEEINKSNPYGGTMATGRPRMFKPKVKPVGHEDYEG